MNNLIRAALKKVRQLPEWDTIEEWLNSEVASIRDITVKEEIGFDVSISEIATGKIIAANKIIDIIGEIKNVEVKRDKEDFE